MHRALSFNKDKCIGCVACVVACKLEHNLPPALSMPPLAEPEGPALIRIDEMGPITVHDESIYYFQPVACMHCLDPPCAEACPCHAISRDEGFGINMVNETLCTGCMLCFSSCPLGVPRYHNGKMILCNLCRERAVTEQRVQLKTVCAAVCPAGAITVVES